MQPSRYGQHYTPDVADANLALSILTETLGLGGMAGGPESILTGGRGGAGRILEPGGPLSLTEEGLFGGGRGGAPAHAEDHDIMPGSTTSGKGLFQKKATSLQNNLQPPNKGQGQQTQKEDRPLNKTVRKTL
jgi:hypothetical protein